MAALSVQYYCAASLDGYIAEVDDILDWLTGYTGVLPGQDLSPVEGGSDDFYADVGALVSGSVTYEFILGELEPRVWSPARTATSPPTSGTSWPTAPEPAGPSRSPPRRTRPPSRTPTTTARLILEAVAAVPVAA